MCVCVMLLITRVFVRVCSSTTQPFSLIGSCRGLPRKPHTHTRVCVSLHVHLSPGLLRDGWEMLGKKSHIVIVQGMAAFNMIFPSCKHAIVVVRFAKQ